MTSDDMYSLECWLRDKALEAHLASNDRLPCDKCPCKDPCGRLENDCPAIVYEWAMHEVESKIQSRRVNPRPHVTMTEEFDGSR